MCRADTCKKETWKIMKDNGCKGVKIGIESGSQYVVDKIVDDACIDFKSIYINKRDV